MSTLPLARLVVTTHTEDGASVFHSDTEVQPFQPFGPSGSAFSNFYSSAQVPVSNTSFPPNLAAELPRCPPGGVTFGICDYPPGVRVPMHRTLSQDYAVVLSGEIVLSLDSGEEKTVRAGEFIVQRGVNHAWYNRTQVPCRVMFVMVAAEQVILGNGIGLEETVFGKK